MPLLLNDADLPALLLRFMLAGLATYRLTMFVVFDDAPLGIMLHIRVALGAYDWADDGSDKRKKWTGDFISCPYCVGQWVALLALVAVLRPAPVLDALLLWQAIAGIQAFMQAGTNNARQ